MKAGDDGGGADIGLGDVMPVLSSATVHDDVFVVAFFPPHSSSSRVVSIHLLPPRLFFLYSLLLFCIGTYVRDFFPSSSSRHVCLFFSLSLSSFDDSTDTLKDLLAVSRSPKTHTKPSFFMQAPTSRL